MEGNKDERHQLNGPMTIGAELSVSSAPVWPTNHSAPPTGKPLWGQSQLGGVTYFAWKLWREPA